MQAQRNILSIDPPRITWPFALREPHLHIRPFLQVDALDEAYLTGLMGEDYRRSPRAFAEKADTFH